MFGTMSGRPRATASRDQGERRFSLGGVGDPTPNLRGSGQGPVRLSTPGPQARPGAVGHGVENLFPGSYLDLRQQTTGYTLPRDPGEAWAREFHEANARLAAAGMPPLPPPPPIVVQAQPTQPQVVYIQGSTPAGAGPGQTVVQGPSHTSWMAKQMGVDILEGVAFVICTTTATWIVHGLFRGLMEKRPRVQLVYQPGPPQQPAPPPAPAAAGGGMHLG